MLVDQWQGFTGLPDFPDPSTVPTHLKSLFDFLASRAVPRYASTAARDAELSSPTAGMTCAVGAEVQVYSTTPTAGWKVLWTPGYTTPFASWATLSPVAGFTGQIRINRSGNWVQIQSDANFAGTVSTGSTLLVDANGIPAPLRPPFQAIGGGICSGIEVGTAFAQTNGSVYFRQQTGASRTAPAFTIVYQVS